MYGISVHVDDLRRCGGVLLSKTKNKVIYNGKSMSVGKVAMYNNIACTTLLTRWTKAGKPLRITDDLLCSASIAEGITIDGVKYQSIGAAAKAIGKTYSWIVFRLKMLQNKKETTFQELVNARNSKRRKLTVTLEGYGEVQVSCLDKVFNKNRTGGFYRHRWEKFGSPKVVTAEMFTEKKDQEIVPALPEYEDPNYLPHITFGDLAHLSEEENTGAGKGEIPDEEWIRTAPLRKSNFAQIMGI